MSTPRRSALAVLALTLGACAAAPRPRPPVTGEAIVARMGQEARALEPFVHTEAARRFLAAVPSLPAIAPRTVYKGAAGRWYTPAQAAVLPEAERRALERRDLDAEDYYYTHYGTPLAYARPLDLLGGATWAGMRVLDFGHGGIGQLRLLAWLGADVTGVEVNPLLPALYREPDDQGEVRGVSGGPPGRVRLISGRFPADPAVVDAVGEGYDMFIAKNVLKRGYLHPERPAPRERLIDVGVDDESFVRTLYRILKPGGRAMIYNLAPAQAPPDKPYIPWADGRCPFPRAVLEAAGFRVLEYDRDDTAAAREMGRLLGWDKGEEPMDLAHDLFGTFTLVEKPLPPAGVSP